MNIALCSVGTLFGGVERHILDLSRYLRRNGLGPKCIVLFRDGELARQLRDAGFEPRIVAGRHRYDSAQARELASIFRELEIDVVHAHGYKATVTCAIARRSAAFDLVITVHGEPESTPAQFIVWAKSRLYAALERYFTRRSAAAVCYVTREIAACHARSHAGLTSRVVHNGIDPIDRGRLERPVELDPTRFNVGIVGRVSRVKGIPFALRALAHPGVPAHTQLVVIGSGPMLDKLKRQAHSMGLANRVSFLGFRVDIDKYLAHLDVLLMPSHHEGLPYTLLEAMALQRPIVASRVGGIAEVLREGESGLMVEVGDVEGIADALRRLAADPELRRALGSAAGAVQAEGYSLDTMGRAYLDVYRRSRDVR